MDKKLERITKNTFTLGSIRDAVLFLDMCVKNAFPDFYFRGLEVTNLMATKHIVEGKSWNHAFVITLVDTANGKAWEITSSRMGGTTAPRKVLLDVYTLKKVD